MARLPGVRYCQGKNKRGEPCTQPIGDDPKRKFCFMHDPAITEESRQAKARAGYEAWAKGQAGALADAPNPNLSTKYTRRKVREQVAGDVRRGKLTDKQAAAILRACDGQAGEDPPPLRVLPAGPSITVNVVVLGKDGEHSTIRFQAPASTPVPQPALPTSLEDAE